MKRILIMLTIALFPISSFAQAPEDRLPDKYYVGAVESIGEVVESESYLQEDVRDVRVRIESDTPDWVVNATFNDDRSTDADDLTIGERVTVLRTQAFPGETRFVVTDKYRLPSLALLLALFFIIAIIFAGKRGFTAIVGLGISLAILLWYTVPAIASGSSPFLVATITAFIIAILSLTTAHGFSKQTGLALLSTLATLAVSLGLAQFFVHTAKLFGVGTEEAFHLTFAGLGSIDLQGLLLAGVIIGLLGVLDDVTTSQTAAVKSLHGAGLSTFKNLYKSAISIGKEHVVSLVNTLALVYVGASLPLLLMFSVNENQVPTWILLNSQLITEEIVRTLVGSTALILAVPISTLVAAHYYSRR